MTKDITERHNQIIFSRKQIEDRLLMNNPIMGWKKFHVLMRRMEVLIDGKRYWYKEKKVGNIKPFVLMNFIE